MRAWTCLAAIAACISITVPVSDFTPTKDGIAMAKKRKSSRRRPRSHVPAGLFGRGTTTGECPCNGGKVCVGPRGGRYCITSGGNKRYGV